MEKSGHLDESWGHSAHVSMNGVVSELDTDIIGADSLNNLMRDTGLFHEAALTAFQAHADASGHILDIHHLCASLNQLCTKCSIDSFTLEEIEELWCDGMNFGEFYILSKELFQAVHRTINVKSESCIPADPYHNMTSQIGSCMVCENIS